jgi:hypothetical protein
MNMASPLLARTYGYLKKVTKSGDGGHNEEVQLRTIDRFVMAITSSR